MYSHNTPIYPQSYNKTLECANCITNFSLLIDSLCMFCSGTKQKRDCSLGNLFFVWYMLSISGHARSNCHRGYLRESTLLR